MRAGRVEARAAKIREERHGQNAGAVWVFPKANINS
jgi:hypothetical protein